MTADQPFPKKNKKFIVMSKPTQALFKTYSHTIKERCQEIDMFRVAKTRQPLSRLDTSFFLHLLPFV
jgi:hypothetical protein